MKIRLFYKLFIAFAAIGFLTTLITEFLIERHLRSGLVRQVEMEMISEADIIALMPMEKIMEQGVALSERTRSRLTLIDFTGRVIKDSESHAADLDNHLNRPEIQQARLKGKGSSSRYSQSLQAEMFYVAVLIGDQKQPKGYIRLSRSLQEVNNSISALRKSIMQGLFLVVFLSLLIALLFSFGMISPIRKLAAFTEKIRTGKISGQIRIQSRDEIGKLADNINEMVEVLYEKIRKADEEKRKLEAVFAGMSEGVAVLDTEDRIESVNRGMEELTGQTAANMTGMTILEAFRNVELHDLLERFRKTETIVCGEILLGEDRPVTMDVTISGMRGETSNGRKTILVFHDMTRLKMLERIRTDFVANVTHEIRTPLTAILGFVETLEQGAVDDKSKTLEFLQIIRDNALRLNRLVDDLLILSGIEMGEIGLHPERVTPVEALERVLLLVEARISEKKLKILNEINEKTSAIRADKDRLVQILINILDNAIKFTPFGGEIAVSASPGAEGFLIIRITDTGVGIPKGEIPRLGERFYRVDKTRSREMGGTGLGLSIVKHLMKAHGGWIGIDSTLGHGTTVSLHFPIFRDSELCMLQGTTEENRIAP
ncbi:MAG: ATP-binding protein [Syntrophales bacterium]|nr:ATP-binding protein [Syntrophales bacterium]